MSKQQNSSYAHTSEHLNFPFCWNMSLEWPSKPTSPLPWLWTYRLKFCQVLKTNLFAVGCSTEVTVAFKAS